MGSEDAGFASEEHLRRGKREAGLNSYADSQCASERSQANESEMNVQCDIYTRDAAPGE